jgi:hypothetical protein
VQIGTDNYTGFIRLSRRLICAIEPPPGETLIHVNAFYDMPLNYNSSQNRTSLTHKKRFATFESEMVSKRLVLNCETVDGRITDAGLAAGAYFVGFPEEGVGT